jgi:hypothetical protein
MIWTPNDAAVITRSASSIVMLIPFPRVAPTKGSCEDSSHRQLPGDREWDHAYKTLDSSGQHSEKQRVDDFHRAFWLREWNLCVRRDWYFGKTTVAFT